MPTIFQRAWSAISAFRASAAPSKSDLRTPVLYANPRVAATETFIRNPSLLVASKSMTVFDKMRNDDMVKAAMALKKQFVIASGYDVCSPEGMPEDWEVTEFVEAALKRMEDSFQNKLLHILTALDYGFSVTEKIYEPADGKLWLKKLVTAAPHDISFKVNEFGEVTGIDQYGAMRTDVRNAPLGKFVIFTWDSDFSNPYGNSDLTAAHRPYIMKAQAYNWMAIMLEKYGIPPIFLHYDQASIPVDVQPLLNKAISDWQSGGFGVFPRGENKDSVEFYTPELSGQVSTVFIPAFQMFNQDIARALLMPGLLGVTPDAAEGSYARSQTHFDVFMLVVEHCRRQVEECVVQEQIIKQLVDLNFPGVKDYPQFRFRPLSDDVRADLITLWGTLTGQRVVQTTPADEDHIRKQLKFPEMTAAAESMPDPVERQASPYGPQPEPAPGDKEDKPDDTEEMGDDDAEAEAEFTNDQRTLTKYELKVSFSKIERDLDELQAGHLARLLAAFDDMKTAVEADIRATWQPTLEYATSYQKLPKSDALLTRISDMLSEGMQRGRASLISELPGAKFAEASMPDADLDDALAYLRAKSFWVSGVTDQKILADVRQALLQGVSNGDTLSEIMDRLRDIFAPYVEESRDENGVLLNPSRLETIVRTNLIDVYNQGRLVQGEQANEYLEGWQYSAILDTRTTEVCRHLDGKVFEAGDKRVHALRPPRHFNCRSVMVPIVIGETIEEQDKITPEQARKARDLSGSSF
jgi:SPP1 gp7 family putative phage head morphogenesis protein